MNRNIYPAQLGRNKACPFTDALFDLLTRDLSWSHWFSALILGRSLKAPVRLGDKVKLITVSVLSFLTATAQEDFDAFCFN